MVAVVECEGRGRTVGVAGGTPTFASANNDAVVHNRVNDH